jgi:hypothetical protein
VADPLYQGPFLSITDLSWGEDPTLVIFRQDGTASGARRSTALVHDRSGAYLGAVEGLADLMVSGPGEVTGLRVTDAGLALFRQPTSRPVILPDAQGAASAWMEGARLLEAVDGSWLFAGVLDGPLRWRRGVAEANAATATVIAPTTVTDPGTGVPLGTVEGAAGLAALDGTYAVGVLCPHTPDALGRAPIALETSDRWSTHRLVEAEAPSGDGPVGWRTSALAAWNGRFWAVVTRTTAHRIGHRLYAFAPGGTPSLIAETGWVDLTGPAPRPRGIMIRAPSDAVVPLGPAGYGGLWAGDRLVLGAPRCSVEAPGGLRVAGGVDGLMVHGGGGLDFVTGPPGHVPLAAWPLGAEGGRAASWLCRLRDGAGAIVGGLTADFRTWALDPFPGDPTVPAGPLTTHRWAALGLKDDMT